MGNFYEEKVLKSPYIQASDCNKCEAQIGTRSVHTSWEKEETQTGQGSPWHCRKCLQEVFKNGVKNIPEHMTDTHDARVNTIYLCKMQTSPDFKKSNCFTLVG